jgi:hypothetical protein
MSVPRSLWDATERRETNGGRIFTVIEALPQICLADHSHVAMAAFGPSSTSRL